MEDHFDNEGLSKFMSIELFYIAGYIVLLLLTQLIINCAFNDSRLHCSSTKIALSHENVIIGLQTNEILFCSGYFCGFVLNLSFNVTKLFRSVRNSTWLKLL